MPTLYAFRLPQTKTALSAILAETCNQAWIDQLLVFLKDAHFHPTLILKALMRQN